MKTRLLDLLVCPACRKALFLEAAGFTVLRAAADAICLHAAKV